MSDNLAMIMRVVERLAPLKDRFVFLGGAVTELFITSLAASPPRQTKDVDVVVNVLGFSVEWYSLAYETATPLALPDGTVIRLVLDRIRSLIAAGSTA